ncbi:MAG: HEAT repeat domain-containing protein [Planctomycetes bacterium]|nr:HEAT repeat domain-containing protein [Planctomycetota bacterium]
MGLRPSSGFVAVLAAVLALAASPGCESTGGGEADEATALQIRGRIESLATLRGADLDENMRILGVIMRDTSVPLLIEALEGHSNPDVRARCAHSLGYSQDGRAVEPLARALSDPNDGVRYTAAYNLGLFRDGRGLPVLIEALRTGDPMNRRLGNQALKSLTGQDFGFDPVAEPEARAAAADRWEKWYLDVGAANAGSRLLPPGSRPR